MLAHFREADLPKVRGHARTDSTHVLASVRQLHKREMVGKTVRAALIHDALASEDLLPDTHIVDKGYTDADLLVTSLVFGSSARCVRTRVGKRLLDKASTCLSFRLIGRLSARPTNRDSTQPLGG